jgi:hypothetical protein
MRVEMIILGFNRPNVSTGKIYAAIIISTPGNLTNVTHLEMQGRGVRESSIEPFEYNAGETVIETATSTITA